jgi:hypothetical protein
MPDRIDVRSVLYRDLGKNPTFFNATQIEALQAQYRSDEGKRPGHRQANEDVISRRAPWRLGNGTSRRGVRVVPSINEERVGYNEARVGYEKS